MCCWAPFQQLYDDEPLFSRGLRNVESMEALTAWGELFPYTLRSLASEFQIYDSPGAHAGVIPTQRV